MADEEGADLGVGESGKVGVREHIDNPLFVLIIIGLFVYGFGAAGRAIGHAINAPGVVTFFGG